MFFDFEGLDFGAERVDFSFVFSKALWRGTFFNFGSNSGPQMGGATKPPSPLRDYNSRLELQLRLRLELGTWSLKELEFE